LCLSAGCSVPQAGGLVAERWPARRRRSRKGGCRGGVAGAEGWPARRGRSSSARSVVPPLDARCRITAPSFRRSLTSLGFQADARSRPEGLRRSLAHVPWVLTGRLLISLGFGCDACSRSAGLGRSLARFLRRSLTLVGERCCFGVGCRLWGFDGGCWVGCVGVGGL